jgi:hypothetical protein
LVDNDGVFLTDAFVFLAAVNGGIIKEGKIQLFPLVLSELGPQLTGDISSDGTGESITESDAAEEAFDADVAIDEEDGHRNMDVGW